MKRDQEMWDGPLEDADQMPAVYRTGSCFSRVNWQPAFCAVDQELMCILWAILIIVIEHFGVTYQFTTPSHPKLQLIRHLTQRKPRLFSPCHVRGGKILFHWITALSVVLAFCLSHSKGLVNIKWMNAWQNESLKN